MDDAEWWCLLENEGCVELPDVIGQGAAKVGEQSALDVHPQRFSMLAQPGKDVTNQKGLEQELCAAIILRLHM